ncbi:SusD/RagB family nutrient-binding outer membrane lipoprotein [Pedobacter metabolipauper]|uniref:SusD-like starch-binding protein associating with outer membrane n=1 Tax=Pedobacter metabolipauper TaxID=425513 RepID=A0A4R6SZL0_9SPHI|nr:SusD/RagB family nutrient-binding outer membrane lipoprotein [Pedobacter metabolipauper]TDQ11495.1 SusD-like starch-binding protein associating with outer membrane [Pedobacter metabolipauper]
MSKLYKSILFFGLVIFTTLISCSKNYQELNENPNGVAIAAPERLLNPSLYAMVSANILRNYSINNDLMQVTVPLSDNVEIHRYILRPSISDFVWNDWYLEKTNFLDMYTIAAQNSTSKTTAARPYMAIANIMDVWVSSLITDTFGDVPYSQANKGKTESIFTPAFDKQEDIYKDMFRKLEEANTLLTGLATAQLFTETQRSLDALYGTATTSDVELQRWRKFGNSLYLRLLLRASAKADLMIDGKTAAQKMAEIVANPTAYPIFLNNSESAILRLTGATYPLRSPFVGYRDNDFTGIGGLGEFFINTLSENADPRLPIWAGKVDNAYVGMQSGYSDGNVPPRGSQLLATLRLEPLLGNIMNYAELQFVLAEAALKGYIPGLPKTYYNLGVQAAIEHWSLTMPANYLTSPNIVWEGAATQPQQMELIMTQKYFATFFTDFEQWYDYRRTGYPTLTIGPGVSNDRILPTRLYYPTAVQSLNRANYLEAVSRMGADDLKTKVWWAKP